MTEKEILQKQDANGQTSFFLIAVGMFYHAYGNGSFALCRATGYRVLRKRRKDGDIMTCGFPASQLDTVLQRIREAGGEVEQKSEKTFLFRGIDGTPDEKLIAEPRKAPIPDPISEQSSPICLSPARGWDWLADELLSFNLSLSTPMDVMNFVASLQKRLREESHEQDTPRESPAGYGLQE